MVELLFKLVNVILNVDAISQPLTGIGNYVLQLARGLKCHPDVENIKFFSAYRWLNDPEQAFSLNQPLAQIRNHIPFKTLALHSYNWLKGKIFNWKARSFKNYILHSPNYILMPFSGPSIVTVHDLSYIHYPQYHPRERIAFMERHMPGTLAQATAIITDSEFIRRELSDIFNVSAEKTTAIPLGIDNTFYPRDRVVTERVLARYGLPHGGYLLVVATLEPRKNLLRFVEAYSKLASALRERFPLVLVGAKGWLNETLEKYLRRLERAGQVRRLGYVPQEYLPSIYAGAEAFAFPSLYEGFGLPVLEAMASGVPVLTSDRASMPEVAGEAALLVNPEDVKAITVGLDRLLTDTEWRNLAIIKGIGQAKRFSWQRCVNETVDLYRQVQSKSRSSC